MNLFIFNTQWMLFNLYLAFLPALFSWFLFKMPHGILKFIVGLLWFLYLPNTVYVFTDMHHLIEQWPVVDNLGRLILIIQYSILEVIGLAFFLYAFYPFERILHSLNIRHEKKVYCLIALNFLMGFALTLGKYERVNSWDVFINIKFVLISTWHLLTSVEYIALSILFGLFSNFFYFLFRDYTKKMYNKYLI